MTRTPSTPAPQARTPAASAARKPRVPSRVGPTLPLWGALCFFLSGGAGLLYEVVWSKQLAYLLGSSLHAVATVVAAFLCGLAIGARVLGVPLARRGNGPGMYALLELGVGVLGLVSLPALRALDPLVGQLYRSLGGEGGAFALARFVLVFVLLLPPTALMGATLPVLVGHFERERVGPALARLYALNTFGAVVGSMIGGFALMPGLGLTGTVMVAAALNVVVAAVAWTRRTPGRAAIPAPPPGAVPGAPPARAPYPIPIVAILFALSGLGALAFQIAWVRLFALVFGSSVYSFAAVLGVYLLGIALGSALVGRLLRGDVTIALFGRLQIALAVAAGFMMLAFVRLPQWMYDLGERSGDHWGPVFTGQVTMTAWLLIVPCALLGAAFPVATRLVLRGDSGHATGFAYAVNTAGTIVGSLGAGFFSVPAWGVQGTHLAATLLALAVGLAAMALARSRGETRPSDLGWASLGIAGVAVLAVAAPKWDPVVMSSGPYRPSQAAKLAQYASYVRGEGGIIERASKLEKVMFYRDGINASVLVGSDPEGINRWLRVGGKIDASTSDMETQTLLGLIPAACADSGARSLVIGLGSGFTAAGVLAGGAGKTEVVELEPAVVEASRFFHEPGKSPLDDPRVQLVLTDARTHLLHGDGRFGLIVSEPSNPWIAGVNSLFTVDFYRRVRARLEPDGVFCQWMQVYEMSPQTFRTMLASFLLVFPEGQVFSIWRAYDVLLIAMPDRRLDMERLRSPVARQLLQRANIVSPEDVLGYYAAPIATLRALAQGATLNTDDRPIVEYRAPFDMVVVGRSATHTNPEVTGLIPFADLPPAGRLFADWPRESWIAARAHSLVEQGQADRAMHMVAAARAAGMGELATRLDREIETRARRLASEQEMEQAQVLIASGNEAAGRAALGRATAADPSNAKAWLLAADRFRLADDLEAADSAIARGVGSTNDPSLRADGAMLAGIVDLARDRGASAVAHFREAQKLNPKLVRAYVMEAQVHEKTANHADARAALQRGLIAMPGESTLGAALASLPAN